MKGYKPGSGAAPPGPKTSGTGSGVGAGAATVAMMLLPLFEEPINNLLYDAGYMGYSRLSDGEMLLQLQKYDKKMIAHEKRINDEEQKAKNGGYWQNTAKFIGDTLSSMLPNEMDSDLRAFAALYRLSQNRGLIDSEGNLTDKGGKTEVPTAKVTRVTPTLENLKLALDKLNKSKSGSGESIVVPGVGVVVRGHNLGGLVHQDKYFDPEGSPMNQEEFSFAIQSVQRKLQRKQTEQSTEQTPETPTAPVSNVPLGRNDPFAPVTPETSVAPTISPTVEPQTAQVDPIPLRRSIPEQLPEPAPNVIYKRVGGQQNQSASLKTGSATDVPSIPSSNPDNFYTMYSQMNYNVVD
jgi:hypothetical protein